MSTYFYGLHPGSPASIQRSLVTSLAEAGFQDIEVHVAEIKATARVAGLWKGQAHHTISIGGNALTWDTDSDDTDNIARVLAHLPAVVIDDAGLQTAIDQAGPLDKQQTDVLPYLATVLTPHDRVHLLVPCHEFELMSQHAVAVITDDTVTVAAMGCEGFTSRVVYRSSIQSVDGTDNGTTSTVRISTSGLVVHLNNVTAEQVRAVTAELS